MSAAGPSDDESNPEDRLAPLLAAFDDRVKGGSAKLSSVELPADLSPSAQEQWERARACLHRLEQAWPRKPEFRSTVVPPAAPPSGTPHKLGRFEIRRELGHGGFGTVHLAYDPQLGREVALKVPHARVYADPDLHDRFDREARMAAGLDHPHIVPVYEAGVVDSVGYIVLAYCPGITLHDWLRRRVDPIPGPEIAEFVAKLANAIQHAHEQSVIHRDLKPANVLLGGKGADNVDDTFSFPSLASFTPKITDFGLAKQLGSEFTHTHTGTIAGTPFYMAPEQTGTRKSCVGPATDVYSLGAILYELLTGRAPFLGETVLDTLDQVRYQDPIPPCRLRPGIPRDLETICLKCLEKDPHRRYRSAKCLEEDLRRYQASQSIAARPTGRITQVAKWARRRPAAAALIAVIALALLVLVGSDLHVRENNRRTQHALEGEIEARGKLTAALASERLALYYHQIRLANAAIADSNVRQAENHLRACIPPPDQRDHRDWEWDYLQGLAHGELFWFRQHRRSVDDIALSADGTRALSVSDDGAGKCWDTSSGQVLWEFASGKRTRGGHGTLAFSPNGALVATGDISQNHTVLRSVDDGRLLHELSGCRCRFSSDGSELVTIDDPPRYVRVFHPQTGRELRSYSLDDTVSAAVAIHNDVTCVATVAADFTIHVRRVPESSRCILRGLSTLPTSELAISSDATMLASGSHDGSLHIWDLRDGRVLADVAAHMGMITAVQFSPDDQHVATTGALGTIRIWNLNGRLLRELPGHGYYVNVLAYNGDGRRLASASADASVKVWSTEQDPKAIVLGGQSAFVYAIDFAPQTKRLASAGTEPLNRINCLAFSWDGKYLASGGGDELVLIWNVETGERYLSIQNQWGRSNVFSLAFSPDGTRLAAGRLDASVMLWDVTNGHEVLELPCRGVGVTSLTFTADGHQLAAVINDGSIMVWNARPRRNNENEHEQRPLSGSARPTQG